MNGPAREAEVDEQISPICSCFISTGLPYLLTGCFSFLSTSSDSQQTASPRCCQWRTRVFQRKCKAGYETPPHPTHCPSGTSQGGLNTSLSIITKCCPPPTQGSSSLVLTKAQHSVPNIFMLCHCHCHFPQGHSQAPQLQPHKSQCRTCCLGLHCSVKLIIFYLFFIAPSKTEISRLFVYLEGCVQYLSR